MAFLASRVLSFAGVSRHYGATRALDGVSFDVEAGGLVALAGENGAGKTTLLRLAATLERPTGGAVRVGGADARRQPEAARRQLAWLGQEPGLYDHLTVGENLAFGAALFGRADEVEPAAAAFGISPKLDEPARRLSRGERQRAALARALLGGPLMLLDEPTSGLDAQGAAACVELLASLRGARTMLVATHDAELLKRADRVLRLSRGRLVG